MKAMWLFKVTAYSYCQGTRDRYEDIRLLTFTLPCNEDEAKYHLKRELFKKGIDIDEKSIESLNINITNS